MKLMIKYPFLFSFSFTSAAALRTECSSCKPGWLLWNMASSRFPSTHGIPRRHAAWLSPAASDSQAAPSGSYGTTRSQPSELPALRLSCHFSCGWPSWRARGSMLQDPPKHWQLDSPSRSVFFPFFLGGHCLTPPFPPLLWESFFCQDLLSARV